MHPLAHSHPLARWTFALALAAGPALAAAADTPIPAIQGRGATSPLLDQVVTTSGVVTRVNANGFFLQDPAGDGDPLSSDGVFVFTGSRPTVSAGELLRLSGKVVEFNTGAAANAATATRPITELSSVSNLIVLGSGQHIAPVEVDLLQLANADEMERYEGMLVALRGPLTVNQNYFLGRYGQATVSAGGRLPAPTNVARPGPDAQALAADNARRSLLLDDGSSQQNPNPTPYLGTDHTLRAGDTLPGLTGVVDFGLATASSMGPASYKLHPTLAPAFMRANPRSAAPAPVGGTLKLASFNVLNYFTTFSNGDTAGGQTGQGCTQGGTTSRSHCRGASNLPEFQRQQAKIVAAIAAIDADALGLMEMQNNGAVAVQNLVDALNARLGAGTYAAVPDPAAGTGSDAIKVAMIYKPARLARVGEAQSDAASVHHRPPLAQTFALPNAERFTLVVSHFKSKGCDGAGGADADQGDLQGCWNTLRVQQAAALRSFVARLQAASGSADVLLLGDLNAYAQEDPVVQFTGGGYVDLIGRHDPAAYSYVFDGAAGRLDHALATPTLAAKATHALEWHINADEPSVLDYNLEFRQPACAACAPDLYTASPYRSSDHDPVVVGLALFKTIHGSARPDRLQGTPGDDILVGGPGPDRLRGGAGVNVYRYLSLRDAGDVVLDFVPGKDLVDLRPLLAGGAGGDPLAERRLRLVDHALGTSVWLDHDGRGGAHARPLLLLAGVRASALQRQRDFLLR
ncbi:MAG: ExeM/NucH family extracellular endonuclease [Pseudomonadota bacterium]